MTVYFTTSFGYGRQFGDQMKVVIVMKQGDGVFVVWICVKDTVKTLRTFEYRISKHGEIGVLLYRIDIEN